MLCYSNHAPTGTLRFNLHRANYDGMRESLVLTGHNYSELSSLNANDAWNYFYDVFNHVIKCNIPLIYPTVVPRKTFT